MEIRDRCHRTNVMDLFNENSMIKVCAPMVRYSKLQFRNLVKHYNTDLVFTPMILSDSFCKSLKARQNEFTTNSQDTPLIVQFASNAKNDFVTASRLVAPYSDGVDLNCGCPQRWAKDMNLGSELLVRNPQIVYEIVRECRNQIEKSFTVSVKMRLQKNLKDTITLAKNSEMSGVSFITVHARTTESTIVRSNDLKIINESVNTIPVIANGGVSSLKDCYQLQEYTGCKGVMVANGILSNPTLFNGTNQTTLDCVQKWLDICYNSTLDLDNYHEQHSNISLKPRTIVEKPYNLTFQCFHHHLVFMLEKILAKSQRRDFNNLKCFKDVLIFLREHLGVFPQLYNSIDEYNKYKLTDVNYPYIIDSNLTDNYDVGQSCGKYFHNKIVKLKESNSECDWSYIFNEH